MRILPAAATLFLVTPAFADLVSNGSFENPTVSNTNNGLYDTLTPGSYPDVNNLLPGWSIDSGDLDLIGTYWNAAVGSQSIDLSGFGAGQISQTLATQNGQQYRLTFYMSGNPDGGTANKQMTVTIGSSSQTVSYDTSVFNPTTGTGGNMQWQLNTITFTATSTSTTLSFLSLDSSAYGPVLDDVQVNEIPEPASLLLFGAGLGGLGLWRRAQKKRKAAARA